MRNPSFADEKMNEKKHNRLALLAVPALLALLMLANGASAVTAVAYPNHSSHLLDSGTLTTFAGSASTLSISTPLTSLTFGATGTLDPSGGWVNAPMTEVQTDYARAELLTSVTMGSGQQAESEAAVGSFVLLPGTTYQVTADFAMSRAFATCSAVWGDTAIANLRVAGQSIYVTSAPNQVVDVLGVARLVINEQTPTSTGITVNALDLSTVTGVQVLVDSAYSSISCTASTGLGLSQPAVGGNHLQPMDGVPVSGVCTDFTTGGGWIPFPPPSTGTKSTFGLVAGYQSGGTTPTGELEYHDHTSGRFDIHSLDVLYYGCGPKANSRVFGGDAEFDHNSGFCYEAFIQDKGEPGAGSDFFQIFLWPPGTPCGSPPTGSTVTTLTSTNPRAFGHFGQSVTVTGSFAVVGAPQETIVEQSGAGHTYVLGATTGSPSATFTSPFPQSGGHFGFSADISGTRVVVGAPGETASGQFGAGHAYVFNATTGSLIATLTSPNAQSGGEFGFSVAISGTTVVVGAPGETSSGHTQAGNAYIYNATSGSLIATLTSPNAQSGGEFGFSVAISSSGVVVGAPGETSSGLTQAGNAYSFSTAGSTASYTNENTLGGGNIEIQQ